MSARHVGQPSRGLISDFVQIAISGNTTVRRLGQLVKQEKTMDSEERIRDLEAQVKEARELLEEFRFIAHGPGCDCAMCVRRTAFLDRARPKLSLHQLAERIAVETEGDANERR
jgi:hypothetical protein